MHHPQRQNCRIIVTCEFHSDHGSLFDEPLPCLIIYQKSKKDFMVVGISLLLAYFRFLATAGQLVRALEVPLVNDLGYTKRYVRCLQVTREHLYSVICIYSEDDEVLMLLLYVHFLVGDHSFHYPSLALSLSGHCCRYQKL